MISPTCQSGQRKTCARYALAARWRAPYDAARRTILGPGPARVVHAMAERRIPAVTCLLGGKFQIVPDVCDLYRGCCVYRGDLLVEEGLWPGIQYAGSRHEVAGIP